MTASDPIRSAVVRAALLSTAREVFGTFGRTSMHPIIYDLKDYSVSIFDDRFNLVADSSGLPEFVGSLSFAVEHCATSFTGDLERGDVIVANDPFLTGAHPPDIAVVAPAVFDGGVVGYCAIRAHMGDVGAKDSYPCDSRTRFEEGMIIPATKITATGETVYRLLGANSRMPRETVGNLRSAVGAAAQGAEKMERLIEANGLASYREAIDELLDRGEHDVRQVIEGIADGSYQAEGVLELEGGDQEPVPLRCEVMVQGSEMTVDVTGSADVQSDPLNVPLAQTIAACRLALKRITTEDSLTANSGEYRPLKVVAPEGSLFNATSPAPTFMMHTAASLLSEMVVTALTPVLPTVVPAPSAGHTTGFSTGFPWKDRWIEVDDLAPIGYGATSVGDGANALQHFCIAGIVLAEAEPWEARAPVAKVKVELIEDSGGAGRWRGGLGAAVAWRFDADARMNFQAQKVNLDPELGLEGGASGQGSNAGELISSNGETRRFGMHSDLRIEPGDVAVLNGAGGGGYGSPLAREPQRVEVDVREGYVSIEAARDVYGVILDPDTLEIDRAATASERARRSTESEGEGRESNLGNHV